MFCEDIGWYGSWIYSNTLWKNTRGVFLFEDDKASIVLVTEPQIPENLKSVLVGLAIYFGSGWMPK